MNTKEWYREKASANSLTYSDKTIIKADWKQLNGTDFSSSFNDKCHNCYHDAIILILRAMNKQETGGYILKKGVVFKYKGKLYTSSNITSQAAEWYIAQDLNHRNDFDVLAKDYDEYEKVSLKNKEE